MALIATLVSLQAPPTALAAETRFYSIQFMAVPMASVERGLAIYERLKAADYFLYYFRVGIAGGDWVRLKAGLFPTITEARAFGEAFKQNEGFDYFVANADARVICLGSGNELITTPNALWLKDDNGYRELLVFDPQTIASADNLDRIDIRPSADESEVSCTLDAREYSVALVEKAPPEPEKAEMPDADAGDAVAYYEKGFAYYKQEQLALAEENFSRALTIDPKYTAAYYYRGIVRYRQGRYDRAIADCTSALDMDPGHVGAYNIRALVWLEKGNIDHAIKDCDAALKIDPQNIAALSTMGVAWLKKGEVGWACSDLQKACNLGRCDTLETARNQGFCQ